MSFRERISSFSQNPYVVFISFVLFIVELLVFLFGSFIPFVEAHLETAKLISGALAVVFLFVILIGFYFRLEDFKKQLSGQTKQLSKQIDTLGLHLAAYLDEKLRKFHEKHTMYLDAIKGELEEIKDRLENFENKLENVENRLIQLEQEKLEEEAKDENSLN